MEPALTLTMSLLAVELFTATALFNVTELGNVAPPSVEKSM